MHPMFSGCVIRLYFAHLFPIVPVANPTEVIMPAVNRAGSAGAAFEIVPMLAFNYIAALSAHNTIMYDLVHVWYISLYD